MGFLGPLVLANGAAQALLGVGPLVVAAVGAGPVTVSAVFVTFLLFRAPLWVIQSVLARVLPPFTALARRGEHAALKVWALRLAAGGAALAAVAAPLGWWLGPTLVGILFGDWFTPTASLTALVAVGTAVAAMTAVSSQILVAVGRTWHVGLAWTLALAVAALAFAAPVAAADVRVGLAFLARGDHGARARHGVRRRLGQRPVPATPSGGRRGRAAVTGQPADGGVAVVLGTRPEIIKLAEVIRLLGDSACVVYTGQHYDDRLGPVFFRELELPPPHVTLCVGGVPRGQQIGTAVQALDGLFARRGPGGHRPGRHQLRRRRRDRRQRP